MSREERRAYKRMMKNVDPYAPPASPAQRVRMEKVRARREASRRPGAFRFVTGRFLLFAVGGAAAAGLLAFSLAWPNMPLAAYLGLAGAAAWGVISVGVRLLQRRMAAAT
jgi:hypothetical protein